MIFHSDHFTANILPVKDLNGGDRMSRWTDIITDSTISRTDNFLDFTMRASKNMQLLIRKEDFSERDSEEILQYLLGQVEYISFGQYLKRYMF